MTSSSVALIKKNLPKSLLYAVILALGALFIVDSADILEISFYVVGGVIIAASLFILIKLLIDKNYGNRRISMIRLFVVVMSLLGGVYIIIYANQGISFYQEVLASIFLFRSIYRFFYAYVSYKTGRKTSFIVFLVLGSVGIALSGFLSLYTYNTKVVGIVAGIAVILEGLYGLYRIWSPFVRKRIKYAGGNSSHFGSGSTRFGGGSSGFGGGSSRFGGGSSGFGTGTSFGGDTSEFGGAGQSGKDEIVITDYEIVDKDESDNGNK